MRHCITVAIALVLPWTALASWDEAVRAYERKDYVTAHRHLVELAQSGEVIAQFNVGHMHEKGLGVAMDYAEAARWYLKAAEQDYSPAQLNLGNLYRFGRGVVEDHAAAFRWWLSAANLGHPSAQYNVGLQYYLGGVIEKDPEKGRGWLERAAANGSGVARELLARIDQASGSGAEPAASDERAGDSAAPGDPATPPSTASRAKPKAPAPEGEAWILAQSPERYTLALMAGTNEKAVRAFLARHAFSEPSAYFRFSRGGQSWFEAISGSFESRQAAIGALRRLPGEVRKNKPWVTQFRKLHDAIRKRS